MDIKLILATLALATATSAVQAADINAGKAKAAVCASCHGADGHASIPTYPNLAGQNAGYIEAALLAYKAGQRTSPQAAIMKSMAMPLNEQDIKNLAAYYSSLK
ncbi:c-type cytochrome [Litoribrevibacter albus]|uniref:Cytochrome c554 n=1 Tax=Litoribrevibacter albus TaxID=1473156 RepID=A0AA37SDU9_9GAMM|nr:cytochrome c [Litoribrevibacter albus]GLQ32661.1 cytochrome c554 [Litoribrevibacter albus]